MPLFLPFAKTIRFIFCFKLIVILCDALRTSTVSGCMNRLARRVVVIDLAGIAITALRDAVFPLVTSLVH